MKVHAVSISEKKGTRKKNVPKALLKKGHGLVGDAHAGEWHRQVSLLAQESIDKMVSAGLKVKSGDFAENITTIGIDVAALPVGTKFSLGNAELTVSQLGKVCHTHCAIYKLAGDCVMPREGIFAVVDEGGEITPDTEITIKGKTGLSVAVCASSEEELEKLAQLTRELFEVSFLRRIQSSEEKIKDIIEELADKQKFDLIIAGYAYSREERRGNSLIFYADTGEFIKSEKLRNNLRELVQTAHGN